MSRRDGVADEPLFVWGATLRAARARRRKMQRRAAATGLGIAALIATIALPPAPRLVWNASASAPVGFYIITYRSTIRRGSIVLAWPPAAVRRLAAERRYLPSNVPLLKQVVAIAGDEVCAIGPAVFINRRPAVVRRQTDGQGRPLPRWDGCRRLHDGQLFLLMSDHPESFDGRYFGVTEPAQVIGKAHLLWSKPMIADDA